MIYLLLKLILPPVSFGCFITYKVAMITENGRDFPWASSSGITKVRKGIFNLASSQISFTLYV